MKWTHHEETSHSFESWKLFDDAGNTLAMIIKFEGELQPIVHPHWYSMPEMNRPYDGRASVAAAKQALIVYLATRRLRTEVP